MISSAGVIRGIHCCGFAHQGEEADLRALTLYIVKSDNGIDVNKMLGNKNPFPEEEEIAIPQGVPSRNVLGVTPVKADGSYVGHSILNPNAYR